MEKNEDGRGICFSSVGGRQNFFFIKLNWLIGIYASGRVASNKIQTIIE